MKILAINSSPNGDNSSTLKLVNNVLKAAENDGAEIELIDLYKHDIEYCKSCFQCHVSGKCIYNDDFQSIFDKIQDADGLVIGAPVFYAHVGAKLKTLIDRMGDPTHTLFLKDKYCCAVSTCGLFGAEDAINFLNFFAQISGGWFLEGVGATTAMGPDSMNSAEVKATELGSKLVHSIKTTEVFGDQQQKLNEYEQNFKQMIQMNKDVWGHTYKYWENKGWLD